MERRSLVAGLMVLASSFLLLVGSASAQPTDPSSCSVRSLPSFIAQGEKFSSAMVGDIIEISCNPYIYSDGAEVTLTASQLYNRCKQDLTWYNPNEVPPGEPWYRTSSGSSFTVHLDVDGNANVGLIAGPECMVGESLITLDENESPYETFTTSFQVLPAVNTTQGLFITPSSQVEDAYSSGVITIAQAEFTGASEETVRIGAEQLYDRCASPYSKHLIIVKANRDRTEVSAPEWDEAINLDNNGNGFALLVGSDSCAEGTSLIEADLTVPPFTTETGTFTVEAPRPERLG